MKFKNFKLHILVNDKPLSEYKISDSDLGFSINRAKKSYVLDKKNRKVIRYMSYELKNLTVSVIREILISFHNSPLATFVAVPEPGTFYKIKYSTSLVAEDKPFKAKVFVDGQNDGGYTHFITCSPFVKEGFCNQDCSKKYKFVFDETKWGNMDESNVNSKYGELGVISVCFYKAKFVKRIGSDCKKAKLGRDLKQVNVSETKDNIDITFTTKFAEEEDFKKPKPSEVTLSRMDKEPIAVLHINYRPVDWFVARGISVKQTPVEVDMSEFVEKPIKLDDMSEFAEKQIN